MNQIGHQPDFTLSLRVQTRVGGSVEDADPATTLQGDPDAIVDQVRRYREAGIEQLVIEPFTSSLDDFLEQIRLFAREVAPRYIHRSRSR
jgi:alkanesulfonate monooxygenase SsuD/methylene tetrahydromethanopterin reductase-like flavin-dependent oxidoreductase (luciferase family)